MHPCYFKIFHNLNGDFLCWEYFLVSHELKFHYYLAKSPCWSVDIIWLVWAKMRFANRQKVKTLVFTLEVGNRNFDWHTYLHALFPGRQFLPALQISFQFLEFDYQSCLLKHACVVRPFFKFFSAFEVTCLNKRCLILQSNHN